MRLINEPEEAEVVKRIYREYLEWTSLAQIKKAWSRRTLAVSGKARWRPERLKKIENEKYIGDAFTQKTYTVVVFTKRRVKNSGIMSPCYLENSHELIIPATFMCRCRRR
ncbi:MAG: hypothetical protein HDR09_02945 [Lachnospiraceae bacterium]|nr:hypothetical protein [Lachnospiraceae bacterium]